jgi:hypothetical protein
MTASCFVRQEATLKIISNVASFCAECYTEIIKDETIFYDMKNCCYLCEGCQEALAESLNIDCESINSEGISLF